MTSNNLQCAQLSFTCHISNLIISKQFTLTPPSSSPPACAPILKAPLAIFSLHFLHFALPDFASSMLYVDIDCIIKYLDYQRVCRDDVVLIFMREMPEPRAVVVLHYALLY